MTPTREELARIACDTMNALGACIAALEDIRKHGKWRGLQEVALKEVQAVYRPFFHVYSHLAFKDGSEAEKQLSGKEAS